jgi:hypothetical protein
MKPSLIIQIPQPCNEPWFDMEATKNGRYCASCHKEVIDFAGYSNQQIATYFAGQPDGICGNFSNDQLNANLWLQQTPVYKGASLAALAFIAMTLTVNPGYGQTLENKQFVTVSDTVSGLSVTKAPNRLKGKITDSLTGKGIYGITLHLKCQDYPVASYIAYNDGTFSIELPQNTSFDHLVISTIDYGDTILPLAISTDFRELNIQLNLKSPEITVIAPPLFTRGSTDVITTVQSKKQRHRRKS